MHSGGGDFTTVRKKEKIKRKKENEAEEKILRRERKFKEGRDKVDSIILEGGEPGIEHGPQIEDWV